MPWRVNGDAVARMICDVTTPDGVPYDGDPRWVLRRAIKKAADFLSFYVIALCVINLVSVVLQCGLGECHTFSYKLLQWAPAR